jgi:membrane associated rhomboid family serine protease
MLPISDNNPTRSPAYVTWALLAINIVVFLWTRTLSPEKLFELQAQRGFIPARIAQLSNPNLIVELPPIEMEQRIGPIVQRIRGIPQLTADKPEIIASLFTSQFLHGSWMHIISNMLFLYIFGNNIEERLGHFWYLVFYLTGGLAAAGLHWATNTASIIPTIGASGAVSAVLGGYAVTYPKAMIVVLIPIFILWIDVELPAVVVLGFWFAGQLLDGLANWNLEIGGGVAFWAHVGGFIYGAAILAIVNQLSPRLVIREDEGGVIIDAMN